MSEIHDWLDRALCKGVPVSVFIWAEPPVRATADNALAYCNVCPVKDECAQDMADTGERYRYQVRAGRRFWTSDVDTLPEPVVYSWEPPKQQVGGDPGPLPAGAFKGKTPAPDNDPLSRGLNPHTRGHWNTDTPKDNR